MQKQKIETKKAPAAIGPYSQAVQYRDLIFCAGQVGVSPATNVIVDGGIKEQTKQAFENLKKVLEASGSSFDNVLKVNVYLKNIDDFVAMNEVYSTYFQKPYPARATVEVAQLPKGALIEIDCIAYTKEKDNCCGSCNCL